MATCKYLVDVELSIYLNDEEFKLLDECINLRGETAYYAKLGGFWYGYVNARKGNAESVNESYYDPEYSLTVTTRQCDTVVLKSLEFTGRDEARELFSKIYGMLKGAIELRTKLNEQVNGK